MDQIAVALIGFGEAGRSFAEAGSWSTSARVFDVLTDDPASADRKRREYLAAGVAGSDTLADAVSRSPLVLSLVTADQAVVAARAAASIAEQKEVWKAHKPKKNETTSWWSVANGLSKTRMYARDASFDDELWAQVGAVIGREARALNNQARALPA